MRTRFLNRVATAAMLSVSLLAPGCAWLQVRVDIYDGDLGDSEPDVEAAITAIKGIEEGVVAWKAGQLESAKASREILREMDAVFELGEPEAATNAAFDAYEVEIGRQAEEVTQAAGEANVAVEAYIKAKNDAAKVEDGDKPSSVVARAKLDRLASLVSGLSGDLGTNYEKIVHTKLGSNPKVTINPGTINKLIKTDESRTNATDAIDKAAAAYDKLSKRKGLEAKHRVAFEAQAKALRAGSQGVSKASADSTESISLGGKADPLVSVQTPKQAAVDAARAFAPSHLERMQNPADPNLRCVTRKKRSERNGLCSEKRWTKNYAKTKFYAEGKSGAVFVRDRVGHIRFQKVENDPKGLIEGSLTIARATADAALKVAAAAGGVPIPGSVNAEKAKSDDSTSQGGSTGESAEALEAERRMLAASRAKLRGELELLESSISSTRGDDVSKEDLARLKSLLRVHQTLLNSTSDPNTGSNE